MTTLKKMVLLAILIRFLIIPFFYHPDIKSQHYHFQFLSKGVLNIYQFISTNKKNLGYSDTFNYLPLTYYTFGSFQALINPFLGSDFNLWLNDWGETKNNNPNINFYMLILKLPYLILDISIAYLLLKIYKQIDLFYLWLFNPISIYLIYILGNFDILPTFLIILSYYYLKKNKLSLSYLSIGIAIALKVYPIIFLPFLFFYKKEYFFKHLKYIWISFLPLVLTIIPFVFQNSFLNSFLGSGLTQKILEYKVYNIPLFPVIYTLILLQYIFSKSKYKFEIATTLCFLFFISLLNFHPQWIIWFFPFVLFIYTKSKLSKKIFYILFFLLSFLYIFLINDNYLFWGHLVAIDPIFADITSPYKLIKFKLNQNPDTIRLLIHQLMLFLSVLGFISYAKRK